MDLRIFTEPQQGASYDQQLAMATQAEALGFDAYFRSDHFLRMGDGAGLPGPTDSWVTLAGLARETERIRLGTLVTSATFRQPGPLAIAVAQVDNMSGGRIELGLGSGWFEPEHTAYGIPFPAWEERFDRLEEQLAVVTGLWAVPSGEAFSFSGRYYTVDRAPGLPKPTQQPRPPLIMGGTGKTRTPALAARFADEFNIPFQPLDTYRASYDRVAAACEAIGRDPATMTRSAALTTCVGGDAAELARRAEASGFSVDDLRADGLAGTPGEAADRLAELAGAGVQRVYLQLMDIADVDHLSLIADALGAAAGEL